jgi:hypothetical protein
MWSIKPPENNTRQKRPINFPPRPLALYKPSSHSGYSSQITALYHRSLIQNVSGLGIVVNKKSKSIEANYVRLSLNAHAPAGSIDDDAHQAAGDDTRQGQSDDPAAIDPADHAPVDGAPGARAEADTDGRPRDALRGRDGKLC